MKHRLFFSAAVIGLLLAPAVRSAETKSTNNADTYRLLNLFGDVFERIRSDYVEEPTDEQLVESAISGMLNALDPHSSYMNAKSFREMQVQTRGEFGGLGIQVSMESGLVKVISPIDDTPAFRAGIEPGDFITHLDGQPVLGLTLNEAVEKMRGRVGSDIRLTIRRGTRDPFEVTVTRAIVKVTPVRARLEGKVGYVRVTSFNEQADKDLAAAMKKFRDQVGEELQGIVLDLRNNPGGLLDQAVAVADQFLDKGEIVSTRSRQIEDSQRYNAKPGDLAKGLPVIVLINTGSASASEIVAGALQDHRRAIVLGTKSFGKGSVQTIIPLQGHGAIRLTTARYYTPSGRSIQAKGIEPDIVVEQAKIETLKQDGRQRESDLRRALDNGLDRGDAPGTPPTDGPGAKPDGQAEAPAQDYQLDRAFDLIRGLALFQDKVAQRAQ